MTNAMQFFPSFSSFQVSFFQNRLTKSQWQWTCQHIDSEIQLGHTQTLIQRCYAYGAKLNLPRNHHCTFHSDVQIFGKGYKVFICTRNRYAEFENERTILICLPVTYEMTDPNCRKISLSKMKISLISFPCTYVSCIRPIYR